MDFSFFPYSSFPLSFQVSLYFRKGLLEAGPRPNCDERLGLLAATYPPFSVSSFPDWASNPNPGLVAPNAQYLSLKWAYWMDSFLPDFSEFISLLLFFFLSELPCCIYFFCMKWERSRSLNWCEGVNRDWKLNVFPLQLDLFIILQEATTKAV